MELKPTNLTPEEFSEIYARYAKKDPDTQEGYRLVGRYGGKVLKFGSDVYARLIELIHGINLHLKRDQDFLLEMPKEGKIITPPKGWHFRYTQYGTPYLKKGLKRNDINFLSNFVEDTEPTLENFFPLNPFNIQAIVYDFEKERIVGDIGMNAINTLVLRINNLQRAKETARRRGMKLEDLIKERLGILSTDDFKFGYAPLPEINSIHI